MGPWNHALSQPLRPQEVRGVGLDPVEERYELVKARLAPDTLHTQQVNAVTVFGPEPLNHSAKLHQRRVFRGDPVIGWHGGEMEDMIAVYRPTTHVIQGSFKHCIHSAMGARPCIPRITCAK